MRSNNKKIALKRLPRIDCAVLRSDETLHCLKKKKYKNAEWHCFGIFTAEISDIFTYRMIKQLCNNLFCLMRT